MFDRQIAVGEQHKAIKRRRIDQCGRALVEQRFVFLISSSLSASLSNTHILGGGFYFTTRIHSFAVARLQSSVFFWDVSNFASPGNLGLALYELFVAIFMLAHKNSGRFWC